MKAALRVCEIAWSRSHESLRELRELCADEESGDALAAERGAHSDALDHLRTTRHFAAYDGRGALAGALRIHPVTPEATAHFGLARLAGELSIYTVSRLVVDPGYRHTAIVHRFYEAVYERARSLAVDALFLDVPPARVMMYEALGFFRCGEGERVGEDGFRVPMLLDLADVEYLREVGSPLFAIAQRYLARSAGSAPIAGRLGPTVDETRPPRRATVVTSENDIEAPAEQLRGVDEWRVSGVLGRSPRQVIARGMPIGRPVGDERRFHAVVSGTVGVMPARGLAAVAYLGAGDTIVEGLTVSDGVEPLSYVALTECVVTSLSEGDIAQLAAEDPQLASGLMYKLMTGLARRVDATTQLLVHDRAPGPRTLRRRGSLLEGRATVVVGEP